jgi:hypothetical protein
MTYHIGLVQENYAAIISDCRVSFGGPGHRGANTALKSGVLFAGCLYAISGSAEGARRFIRYCRDEIHRRIGDESVTLRSLWDLFLEISAGFRFDRQEHFQLLLSSRCHGGPKLFLLDSHAGAVTDCGDFVTVGRGKSLLDSTISDIHSDQRGTVAQLLDKKGLYPENFPYLYCMLLMERVQGMELSALEKHGVGGIFHFLIQSPQGEGRQPPAMYVLVACPLRQIWVYRVSGSGAALIVHNPVTNSIEVMTDPAVWPGVENLSDHELRQKIDEIVERDRAEQPWYHFAAIGFTSPRFRGQYLISFSRRRPFVSRDGVLDPEAKAFIDAVCEESEASS